MRPNPQFLADLVTVTCTFLCNGYGYNDEVNVESLNLDWVGLLLEYYHGRVIKLRTGPVALKIKFSYIMSAPLE